MNEPNYDTLILTDVSINNPHKKILEIEKCP